jgi:hypothetical protein
VISGIIFSRSRREQLCHFDHTDRTDAREILVLPLVLVQDRRESHHSWPLCRVPDGRDRHSEDPLRRHLAFHAAPAIARGPVRPVRGAWRAPAIEACSVGRACPPARAARGEWFFCDSAGGGVTSNGPEDFCGVRQHVTRVTTTSTRTPIARQCAVPRIALRTLPS